jgi:hypothetical protein
MRDARSITAHLRRSEIKASSEPTSRFGVKSALKMAGPWPYFNRPGRSSSPFSYKLFPPAIEAAIVAIVVSKFLSS